MEDLKQNESISPEVFQEYFDNVRIILKVIKI